MSSSPREPQVHEQPCPGCGAKGFGLSVLGPSRCTFCDGSENSEFPTLEEQQRAWSGHVSKEWPFGQMPNPLSGYSGGGITMVAGSEKDMAVVRRALDFLTKEEYFRTLVRHQREEIGKLAARLRKYGEIV